ncbi:MAG: hypothetical protein KBS83_00095 [Lachnospiraceae bacterium]|nr:hypothetical protein [Candidatus Equihabitans merdae]
MDSYTIGKFCGILVGVVIGIIIVWIALKWSKNDGKVRAKYDERQTAIRGRGYALAFYTTICLIAIYALFLSEVPSFPMMPDIALMIIVFIGVILHVSYCIWNGAYFSLNENKTRVMICFVLVGLLNMVIGINNIIKGSAFTDGKLNIQSLNLICGLLFVAIFLVIFIRKVVPVKDEDEEE